MTLRKSPLHWIREEFLSSDMMFGRGKLKPSTQFWRRLEIIPLTLVSALLGLLPLSEAAASESPPTEAPQFDWFLDQNHDLAENILPRPFLLASPEGGFTVQIWLEVNESPQKPVHLISLESGADGLLSCIVAPSSDKDKVSLQLICSHESPMVVPWLIGAWQNLALVKRGKNLFCYVNGALVQQGPIGPFTLDRNAKLQMGATDQSLPSQKILWSSVLGFDRALSVEQVRAALRSHAPDGFDSMNVIMEGKGLVAVYYENTTYDTPLRVQVDDNLELGWHTESSYYVVWHGEIIVASHAPHLFHLHSNGPARFTVDDKNVIDIQDSKGGDVFSSPQTLDSNSVYQIQIFYTKPKGKYDVNLDWSGLSNSPALPKLTFQHLFTNFAGNPFVGRKNSIHIPWCALFHFGRPDQGFLDVITPDTDTTDGKSPNIPPPDNSPASSGWHAPMKMP